jgi:hypothetical protein
MTYPKMLRIRQKLDTTRVANVQAAIKAELERLKLSSKIKPGGRVAITAGSRGISDIVVIIAAIVREVKKVQGNSFIVPAMGSHGGATAEGQLEVLGEYGITEQTVGAPIVSSMEVVQIGETKKGITVLIDRKAAEADHIIVVNRIKAHTEFQGRIESGLMKMMVIGLGKHEGTILAHRFAVRYGYEQTITEIGQHILGHAPIALGVCIVENGFRQTAQITAIDPEDFLDAERKLLDVARAKTPKLPFDKIDILIVDEAGKDISGTGMDTKVVGRIMNIYELEVDQPRITRIILRALSEKTRGNAIGVGLADFVTKRVSQQMDYKATYVNCVTAVTPEKGRLPIVCENDQEALDFAMATAGPIDSGNVRIVWIKNTSHLNEMFISKGLLTEAKEKENLEISGNAFEMEFDEHGHLVEFWSK